MSSRWSYDWPAASPPKGRWALLSLMSVGLFLLYTLTASRTIQGGDCGEFLTVVYQGGRVHPPGYPLYVLIARAFVSFPHLNPALMLSLLSGVFGVGTALALYGAMKRWGLSTESSILCVWALGVSPLFWRYSGIPEVFTLSTFIAALLLWIAGRGGAMRGWSRAFLVGFVFGLGLSNHHTIILFAPVVAVGLYRAFRETARNRLITVFVVSLAGLLVGLLPYLTLLGGGDVAGWYWGGDGPSFSLVDHVLRRDYGTLSLGLNDQSPDLLENPVAYLAGLPRRFSIVFPLGLVGIVSAVVTAWKYRNRTDDLLDSSVLLLTFVISSVGFLAVVNLKPEGLAISVLERFYLLPDLLYTFLCAAGLESILRLRQRFRYYARACAAGILSVLTIANIALADWSDDTVVEDYVFNSLDFAPPRSVIVGTGDLPLFGFLAASDIFSRRTDVVYVDLYLLTQRWYFNRISHLIPDLEITYDNVVYVDLPWHVDLISRLVPSLEITYDKKSLRVVDLLWSLTEHHSVFVASLPEADTWLGGPALFSYPIGPLLAVVRVGDQFPRPTEVERMNRAVFGQMVWRSDWPEDPNSWGAEAFRQYARTWGALSRVFRNLGREDIANQLRLEELRFTVD